ncbi:ATPase [Mesorhizobium sp. M1A.F.Ca.ET.072.01.1.1]|uniref:bifunctional DNA primase/polymerase n=1 Tax=Mesorhizobium sp. M1A.F.Ca.ET.072.01.1.1 TaxID=2496753 RepID=UPI000FD1BBFC|nr:bifunctional DNA primase/polymerase [Mesorhizobium sp. M1A.F.Ca.ET.072.01.1.1]RUW55067.1 ATPase [Mesorhizobium sp. M1A.F.Ca.ET.072.01.1.1]TIV04696.1 MAG: ATPase [Mesorhizobium sp.]
MTACDNLATLDRALFYIAKGFPVFPCRGKEEWDDHTGDYLAPKTPLTSNGLRGATKNERIVREWWRRTPDAMIGLPTGKPTGVWVLDLDKKAGVGDGHEWLDEMEARHGPLPDTARATTMGGGTHLFFKYVDGIRNRGGLGLCVDVRGTGGYVIAPGSVAGDGRGYEWVDGYGPEHIVDAPQWLLSLVLPPKREHHHPVEYHYQSSGNTPYVERALEDELRGLATTPPGGRGYALNASAFSVGQLVGAGAVSRSDAEGRLYDAAMACGVAQKDGERETLAKIRRGLDAGERQPRHIPEPGFAQDNTRLVDVKRMIANGLAKGRKPTKIDAIVEPTTETEVQDKITDAVSEARHKDAPPITITPYMWKDPRTLPRREFAFGKHYVRKYVSVTVAPGGLGKTSNSIVEALSMTSSKMLTGTKPDDRLRVWLFNAEDPRDELERRIQAAAKHYNLSPDDMNGYLFVDTGREQELVVAVDDKKGVKIQVPIVEAVVEQIQRHKIDVMIVDPFVSTHSVNENDNGAIDKVAKLWGHIADETNCAIDIVHHLKKLSDREATVEDARGAVSLIGAARSVRVLNRMTAEQATKAGIDRNDRFSYFYITQGKANLTKQDHRADWRKLESVALGNGVGLTSPQDHAGVVTKWDWPSDEEVAETVSAEIKDRVLVTLGNQDHRESAQSDEWAGYVLAEAMGVDVVREKVMSAEKKRMKAVLDAWLGSGIISIETRPDPKHVERKIKYIRPAATTSPHHVGVGG